MSAFPTSLPQFQAVFPDHAACRAYLLERRWPDGFRCLACGHDAAWERRVGRFLCRRCRVETSVTAGTVLHGSRLSLLTWFWSAYLLATTPGLNALTLGRLLGLSSRETAWTILDRLRGAMSSMDLPMLSGLVEADEMALGGFAPGKRGFAGANKTTVLVLVERGSSRTRLVVVPDRKSATLVPIVSRLVEVGSTVITDGHDGDRGLTRAGYTWIRVPHPRGGLARGGANRATPAADGTTSRFRRWLTGTYNKPPANLTRYLAEFCFRAEYRNDPEGAFSTLLGLAVR
ncbi:MAG: IS1595 family transposase [Chloroflexota bacterium]